MNVSHFWVDDHHLRWWIVLSYIYIYIERESYMLLPLTTNIYIYIWHYYSSPKLSTYCPSPAPPTKPVLRPHQSHAPHTPAPVLCREPPASGPHAPSPREPPDSRVPRALMNSRQLLPIPASKTTNSHQFRPGCTHFRKANSSWKKIWMLNAYIRVTWQHVAGGRRELISIVLDTLVVSLDTLAVPSLRGCLTEKKSTSPYCTCTHLVTLSVPKSQKNGSQNLKNNSKTQEVTEQTLLMSERNQKNGW
jgi:hypothetical protein